MRKETPEVLLEELWPWADRLTIDKATKDIRENAIAMQPQEAKFLVTMYYQIQRQRTALGNQRRSSDEQIVVHDWLTGNVAAVENQCNLLLTHYAKNHEVGRWSNSIHGIGPIISAALLAYINIHTAPTVGHIWRYAGIDPTSLWRGKDDAKAVVKLWLGRVSGDISDDEMAMIALRNNMRVELFTNRFVDRDGEPMDHTAENAITVLSYRPWNAKLKTICYHVGECLIKAGGSEKSFYGPLYAERKEYEKAKNVNGDYADQAAAILEKTPNHAQKKIYAEGKLSDGHIHARARRWIAKLFLAHWHHVAWCVEFGEDPPKPYVLTLENHTHEVRAPNWPMDRS